MGRWVGCCQSREAEGQLALWLAVLRDCVNAHWWMRGGDVGRGTERGVEWVDKGTMVTAASTGFCHWAMLWTGTRRKRHLHLCGYHAPRHLRATAPASSSISGRLSQKVRHAVTQTFHLSAVVSCSQITPMWLPCGLFEPGPPHTKALLGTLGCGLADTCSVGRGTAEPQMGIKSGTNMCWYLVEVWRCSLRGWTTFLDIQPYPKNVAAGSCLLFWWFSPSCHLFYWQHDEL